MLYRFLIKKGKKTKAKDIVFSALYKVARLTKFPIYSIMKRFYRALNISVELRTITNRRGRYLVPFPINMKRRIYLISKWFLKTVKENNKRDNFSNKLASEMSLILSRKKKQSKTYQLRSLNISKALQHRANIHYRW